MILSDLCESDEKQLIGGNVRKARQSLVHGA